MSRRTASNPRLAKRLAVASILLFVISAVAEDLTTRDGKVYKDASITAVTPAYVSITHREGVARIKMEDLPDDLQKKYGYDPREAVQQMAAEAQAQATAAKGAQIAAKLAEFDKHMLYVEGSISQVADGGVLFRGSAYRIKSSNWSERTKRGDVMPHNQSEREFVGGIGPVFISGSFPGAIDGDGWRGWVWPAGTYRYESVGAGTKTIERWATSRNTAIELLGK